MAPSIGETDPEHRWMVYINGQYGLGTEQDVDRLFQVGPVNGFGAACGERGAREEVGYA